MPFFQESKRRRVARLVDDYGDKAFRFAYGLTGNIETAKDLVQDSFERAIDSLGSYDSSQPLENWFFSILRRLFVDHRRRAEVRTHLSIDAPLETRDDEVAYFADILPEQDAELLNALEKKEAQQTVQTALRRLSKEHRAIINLSDVEGFDYARIAQVLDLPPGTIRSRLFRARLALKKIILEAQ